MKVKAINIRPENKGKLHMETNTPVGKVIPLSKIKAKEHSADPAVRKEAQFADNARRSGEEMIYGVCIGLALIAAVLALLVRVYKQEGQLVSLFAKQCELELDLQILRGELAKKANLAGRKKKVVVSPENNALATNPFRSNQSVWGNARSNSPLPVDPED